MRKAVKLNRKNACERVSRDLNDDALPASGSRSMYLEESNER